VERILRVVLRSRRKLLGDDYPATLIARQHQLELWISRGVQTDEAEAFQLLATDAARVFGIAHPRTHKAGLLYAEALAQLGRKVEASALIRWFLADRAAELGPEHPYVLIAGALLERIPGNV
jgi:hypothetical protein